MTVITTNLLIEPVDEKNHSVKARNFETIDNALSDLESGGPVNHWDLAHEVKVSSNEISFAEPNQEVLYNFDNPAFDDELEGEGSVCDNNNEYDEAWPYPKDGQGKPIKTIWHLGNEFSELKQARESVASSKGIIRIAHFDTGYDPSHFTYSDVRINHDLERNFVDDELPDRASDNYDKGLLNQPGHGTGTFSILAGAKVKIPEYNFDDYLGIQDGFEIVPIRISKSVILFKNSAFVKAVDYIVSLYDNPATRVHVITMSMGGLPSKAWAKAVNTAYEKGIFIVSAAGNNFGRATPRTLIYPARFNRVVAACGVTYDKSPYYKPFDIAHPIKGMQGNFGPRRVMKTAIAAFTPNMPWAKIGCRHIISLAGAGTSSATPQIAASAAIYYRKYMQELDNLPEGWMRVESIRYALFETAKKEIKPSGGDIELFFGNGILQANKMLAIKPDVKNITKSAVDSVSSPFLKLFLELRPGSEYESAIDSDTLEMFELEILQLIQQLPELQKMTENEEVQLEELTPERIKEILDFIANTPKSSDHLKDFILGLDNESGTVGRNLQTMRDNDLKKAGIRNFTVSNKDTEPPPIYTLEDLRQYDWTEKHTQLKEIFASLVPISNDIPQFIRSSGLPIDRIDFNGPADWVWQNVILLAIYDDKVNKLIAAMLSRFPDNPYMKTGLKKEEIIYSLAPEMDKDIQWVPFDEQTLEVLTDEGVNTLKPISFLETGLLMAKSVAKVQFMKNGIKYVGSGFLITDNIFITNHHVIPDVATAEAATLLFNYEEDRAGNPRDIAFFKLDSSRFITSNVKEYDYTAVKIKGDANAVFGALELNNVKVEARDFVNIIQHPAGDYKKIALYHNVVTYSSDREIQYLADTLKGSSGSPVFNSNWQVVAIHHSGGLSKEGEPGIKFSKFRNEGINIGRIKEGIDKAKKEGIF